MSKEKTDDKKATPAAAKDDGKAEEVVDNPGETIPGGKYLASDGKTLINADGEAINEKGEKLDKKKEE